MNDRTKGLIATVATAVVCGCFGLFAFVFGLLGALQVPFQTTDITGASGTAPMPSTLGYVLMCLSLILFAIPIAVGFLTLRKKPGAGITGDPTVPPAS
jgi:hypothetical protein